LRGASRKQAGAKQNDEKGLAHGHLLLGLDGQE
jgi:hypothetical protein